MRYFLSLACLGFALSMQGQFGPAISAVPVTGAESAQAIDVDGDGALDIVSLEPGQGLVWYRNTNGLGDFGPAELVALGTFDPTIWAMADLTGDGAPEAVFVGDGGQALYWALNNGSGGFAEPLLIHDLAAQALNVAALVLAEVTGDGLLDIIFSARDAAEVSDLFIGVNNAGAFTSLDALGLAINGPAPTFILSGDLDLSGGNDLVVQDMVGQLIVLRNTNGEGTDWQVDAVELPDGMYSFVRPQLIDVDGDGDPDLAEAGFPNVFWRENPLLEGGVWGAWTAYQLEAWSTSGPGLFGNLGCGSGAGFASIPLNPSEEPRYAHWLEPLGAFSARQNIPDLPRGVPLLFADFDGDGRDDLYLRFEGQGLLLRNTTETPVEPALLPQLPTLCRYGAEIALPEAQPSNGQWVGHGVFQNGFLRSLLPSAGTYALGYSAYADGGCAVGDVTSIRVIDEPIVSPFIGGPICRNEPPIQLNSNPEGVVWYGIGQDGVFDPATFVGGIIVAEYTDLSGEVCAAESFPIQMLSPLPVNINPVGPFCVNSGPQLITGSTVTPYFEWSGDIESWNTSGATFLPSQGAGTYMVVFTAQPVGPTQCAGLDTLFIVVNDVFPDVQLAEIPILCAGSGPVDLDSYAQPEGGIWAGPGVLNGAFDPGAVAAGSYLITYTASLGGCISSQAAAIKVLDEAEVTPSASLELCPSDAIVQFTGFPAGGTWGAPLDSDGTFNPSGAAAGTYAVTYNWTGIDGCSLDAPEQIITVLPLSDVEIEPAGVLCDDQTEVLIVGNLSGLWTGAAEGEGATVVVNPAALGVGTWPLTLTATSPGQCPGSTTVDLVVEVCTGIEGQQTQQAEAWPNPFTDELTLRIGNRAVSQVELLDAAGRLVAGYGRQPAGGQLALDQRGALPGAYLIRLWLEGAAPQVLRVLKL